jgi:phospholipid/cholesterol/gamma-HCH transport system substrate-binding protein
MELRYRREALVGLLIIGAAVAFAFGMLWLKGQGFRSGRPVDVRFPDVTGLKVGDQVRMSGLVVGNVRSMTLQPDGRVLVVVAIKRAPPPRTDARFAVRALDLLGAKYVDYRPGSGGPLPEGQAIDGVMQPELADLATGLAGESREILASATELLGPRMANELRLTLREAQTTLQTLARAGSRPSDTLIAALSDLRRLSQRLDILLARTSDPLTGTLRSMERVSAGMAGVTQTLAHTSTQLDTLLSRLNSGRGAAGQLLTDTTVLAEFRRTNRALGDLLLDLRANPGRYLRLRL